MIEANTRQILAASESVERVFGYLPEAICGRTTEFLHVDENRFLEFDKLSGASVAAGEAFRCRYRMRRQNGEDFDTEHFVYPITDDEGQLQAVIGFIRDLTDFDAPPLPSADSVNFERLAETMPGAVFQATRDHEGSYSYNFFRGNLLHRIGLASQSPESDFEAVINRLSEDERQRLFDCMERTAITLSVMDLELTVRTDNGELIWSRGISQPRTREDGSVVWDGILFDITDQQRSRTEIYYLHTHDSLTGLPNREFFDERINAILPGARESGEKIVVGILNLVRFRSINQAYGFNRGDEALRQVARRLETVAYGNDMVARFHGDEFLFFFQGLANEEAVLTRVHDIIRLFNEPVEIDPVGQFSLEAKLGLALFPDHGETAEDLRERADVALRHVRARSGESYAFYSRTMTEAVIVFMEMEKKLSRAIKAGVIEPHYQPQYELAGGRLSGFEALARWPEENGFVPPGQFIPLAEKTGLIGPLSTMLRNRLLADFLACSQAGLKVPPIAINISALTIQQSRFTEWMLEMFDETGVVPENIVVEITESAILHDYDHVFNVMTELSSHGVLFSIDDFGTGFSSLSYLTQLDFPHSC